MKLVANFEKSVLGVTPSGLSPKTKFQILMSPIQRHLSNDTSKRSIIGLVVEKILKRIFIGVSMEPTKSIFKLDLTFYQTHLYSKFGVNRIEIYKHTHTQTYRKSFQPRDRWRNITPGPLGLFVQLVQQDMICFSPSWQQKRKAKSCQQKLTLQLSNYCFFKFLQKKLQANP